MRIWVQYEHPVACFLLEEQTNHSVILEGFRSPVALSTY